MSYSILNLMPTKIHAWIVYYRKIAFLFIYLFIYLFIIVLFKVGVQT